MPMLREHRYLQVETHMRASQAHHVFFQLLFDFNMFSTSKSAMFFTSVCHRCGAQNVTKSDPKSFKKRYLWLGVLPIATKMLICTPKVVQKGSLWSPLYPQSGPKGLHLEAIGPQRGPQGTHFKVVGP